MAIRKKTAPKHYKGKKTFRGLAGIEEVNKLRQISGLSIGSLSILLGITARTLRNKRFYKQRFNLLVTERISNLSNLFTDGISVFGNKTEFLRWLKKPAYGLDYAIPINLIAQPGGLNKVSCEVSAIKLGQLV